MYAELLKEPELPESEYLTDLEIKDLINNLSQIELLKLQQIAQLYIWGCQMEAGDLLHEAIVAVLSKRRKIPRNINFFVCLVKIMKSISSNERQKLPETIDLENTEDSDKEPIINNIADENINIEVEGIANQQIEFVYKLFKDDEDITMLLMAKYEGLNPDEVCEMNDWTRIKYDTVQKRLRRALNKNFPNGRES